MNVNTLTLDDAPLLAAAFGDAVTPSTVLQLIDARTPEGYESAADFLGQPLLAGREVPSDLSALLDVKSGLIEMDIVLETDWGRLRQSTLLRRDGQRPEVIERRVGERLP